MKNKVFTAGLALTVLTVFFSSCENPAAQAEDYGSTGKFVAIASGSGDTAWSEDGKTWNSGGRLPADIDPDNGLRIGVAWSGIAYGRGKLAAVSYGPFDDIKAAWSADGLAWREADLPEVEDVPVVANLQDVAYGNGKFVAVASNSGSNNRAAYSPDGGSTWTASSSLPSGDWYGVAYGNGKFVAVDGSSGRKTAASADGGAWVEKPTLPTVTGYWSAVVYGNGKFIAFSTGGDTVYSTDDGETWSAKIAATESGLPAGIHKAVYGGNRFAAVSGGNSDSNKAAWSKDGVSWTAVTLPATTGWQDVTYGKGVFVAVAEDTAAWSEDGAAWTAATLPALQTGASWAAVTFIEAY